LAGANLPGDLCWQQGKDRLPLDQNNKSAATGPRAIQAAYQGDHDE
jgi:hypothetical protein